MCAGITTTTHTNDSEETQKLWYRVGTSRRVAKFDVNTSTERQTCSS